MKKKVFAGFDGSVDRNVKPIRVKGSPNIYFNTIGEFGSYLASKVGLSCSIQSDVVCTKAGGNAPYVAQTLNSLGYEVYLVGMLGETELHKLFTPIKEKGINLYTFAAPAETDCYEFDDGKIIMAPQIPHVSNPFELVRAYVPQIAELVDTCDLVAMLNWGEIAWMHNLWDSCLDCITGKKDVNRYVFFDLADISCRKESEILELLCLLKKSTRKRYTVLSLNENELLTLGSIMGSGIEKSEMLLKQLVDDGFVDEVVVHTVYKAIGYDGKTLISVPTCHVEHPLISTGAGDNFNGGYCAAVLENLPLEERLVQANHTSYVYLTTGSPATSLFTQNDF